MLNFAEPPLMPSGVLRGHSEGSSNASRLFLLYTANCVQYNPPLLRVPRSPAHGLRSFAPHVYPGSNPLLPWFQPFALATSCKPV